MKSKIQTNQNPKFLFIIHEMQKVDELLFGWMLCCIMTTTSLKQDDWLVVVLLLLSVGTYFFMIISFLSFVEFVVRFMCFFIVLVLCCTFKFSCILNLWFKVHWKYVNLLELKDFWRLFKIVSRHSNNSPATECIWNKTTEK